MNNSLCLQLKQKQKVKSESYITYLLMLDTLGTFSWLQTPSVSSLSLISQANMVGFSFLYLLMASTTGGVATLGLLPPITPAL